MPRIVIVTGAAAGIGLATARAFAAAGDTVVLTDLAAVDAEARAAELGVHHVGLAMDVSDEAAVVAGIAAVMARFRRIDVLVNNAGIVDLHADKLFDTPIDMVRRLAAVNVAGSWLVAREAGRGMLARGSGSIVNLSSGAALSALPTRTPYSMTKAAILGLTRSLAVEWAGRGMRVNAVLPGYVRTEILAGLERAGRFGPRQAGTAVPLGRLAEPAEIAAAILHVAGAEHLNGAALLVDGGYAAFGGRGPASAVSVSGRVPDGIVLVAGGASGAGAAVADRFRAMGRKVVGTSALPGDRTGTVLDVTDEAAVEVAVAQIGPIAVLVHVTQEEGPVNFRRSFDREAIGAFILSRAVARRMAAAGKGGAIVNLLPTTPTSGTALTLLTRGLACEWAEHGIRVNAVALAELAGTVEAVAFLASDAASYVTGTTYSFEG